MAVDFASQIKATGHGRNKNRRFDPFAEERRAEVQFGDVEFGKRVVEKAVAVKPRSRRVRNAIGIEAEFEMLFFTLLGFRQSFLDPAWHGLAGGFCSPLFFGDPPFLRSSGEVGRLSRVRMTTHPFIVPAMKQTYIDIELIQDSRGGLIDHF